MGFIGVDRKRQIAHVVNLAEMTGTEVKMINGIGFTDEVIGILMAHQETSPRLPRSTPAGEMAANIIISGSQYERRLISQRTRDALAAKRARGERLGAAPALPLDVTRRIVTERRAGRTFQAIAEGLMADAMPPPVARPAGIRPIKAVVTTRTTPPHSRSAWDPDLDSPKGA